MIEPIRKSIVVKSTLKNAFETFVDNVSLWWPLEAHSVFQKNSARLEIETKVGGCLIETSHSKETCVWGTVTEYSPSTRIAFTWHPGREPSTAQQVIVSFAEKDGSVTVSLEHRGWETLGERAMEIRGHYTTGWDGVFGDRYRRAVAAPPQMFFVLEHTQGPKWDPTLPFQKQEGVHLHMGFMRDLWAKGTLIMGGPFLDNSGGMAIVSAQGQAEALSIAESDPSLATGVINVTVRPWLQVMRNTAP